MKKHRAYLHEASLTLPVKFKGSFCDKCILISGHKNAASMMVRGALCVVLKGVVSFAA
jgi:RNase P subunit RPR2